MKQHLVCPACAASDHDHHQTVYPTGFQVPDRDPYRDRDRMVPEMRVCSCPVCVHIVDAVRPDRGVQAVCTCGWEGPDRTGDEHAARLVMDDADWHHEMVGVR